MTLLGDDAQVVAALAAAPDPDQALAGLARMGRDEPLLDALRSDRGLRARLAAVLGASTALADHLRRHPDDWRLLSGPDAERAPGADELRADLLGATQPGELRVAYRRRLLRLAARDLTGAAAIDDVMAELADLAAAALEAALAIARTRLPPDAPACRLAVIAMGKCGARELNYSSDVDVIFVAEPAGPGDETGALRTATQLASAMIRVCSETGPEGSLFPVDPNLRPEGRSGPLVRTLASHLAYYQRWAKTWEFQALLKARPVAGDRGLGQDYLAALEPLVWHAAQRDDFVADVQAMRRRVVASLPAGAGRARDQARPRRPAGHRVRRPAAPARARPGRRDTAGSRHPARARRAGRRRVRRQAGRGEHGTGVPVPAGGRAPASAAPAEADPLAAH